MSAESTANCSLSSSTEMNTELDELANCTSDEKLDPVRLLLIPIFIVSLIGNVCTLGILAKFRKRRVADVLVGALALSDLVLTLIPFSMTLYSYLTLVDFPSDSPECVVHAVVSVFTRTSACLIVGVISVDKCFAICTPFSYRKHATPKLYSVVVCVCWLFSASVAFVPAIEPNSPITSHTGFCLFDLSSTFAVVVLLVQLIQFGVVFVSFMLSTLTLLVNVRSRMKRSGQRTANRYAEAKNGLSARDDQRFSQRMIKFRRTTMQNLFQVRMEAEFVTMFTVVAVLFYLSWLPVAVSI